MIFWEVVSLAFVISKYIKAKTNALMICVKKVCVKKVCDILF